MKDFKIFIFLMAVCTLCFCSPTLYAQKKGQSTMKSLTHRDWIWQCTDNMFIYMHFDKNAVTATMYSRSSWSFNTHIPNRYNRLHSEFHPYYLSDSIPTVFEYDKVDNTKRGRYLVLPTRGIIMSPILEIVKVDKDSLVLRDNNSKNGTLYKAIKKKELNKLLDTK
ncbi:hypothetical protein VCM39_16875 [Bacteroides sp. CG01]|nr:hypothetical protein [Bacteroides sp. CG01]